MPKSISFTLKIADTPTADDSIPIPINETKRSPHRKRRGGSVQKVSPEEMREEIDRMNRLNGVGKPAFAEGTEPDSDSDG